MICFLSTISFASVLLSIAVQAVKKCFRTPIPKNFGTSWDLNPHCSGGRSSSPHYAYHPFAQRHMVYDYGVFFHVYLHLQKLGTWWRLNPHCSGGRRSNHIAASGEQKRKRFAKYRCPSLDGLRLYLAVKAGALLGDLHWLRAFLTTETRVRAGEGALTITRNAST